MPKFLIKQDESTGKLITEGATNVTFFIELMLNQNEVLNTNTVLTWKIVPKGQFPATANDFTSLTGTVTFNAGTTANTERSINLPLAPDNTDPSPTREFDIVLYDDTTEINRISYTLADNDGPPIATAESTRFLASIGNDIFVVGNNLSSTALVGEGGDDIYIITPYQYGHASISDVFGTNTIKFDAGVTITSYEVLTQTQTGFGTTVTNYLHLKLNLSTGGTVNVSVPKSSGFQYQIGNGDLLTYDEFIAELTKGGTTDVTESRENNETLVTRTLTSPYVVNTPIDTSTHNITVNQEAETRTTTGGYDIIAFGNANKQLELNGGNGNDIYIITPYQYGHSSISDVFGTNTIKFDAGVTITSYEVLTQTQIGFGTTVTNYLHFKLTLSTGGTIQVNTPKSDSFQYQIADGDVLTYADFLTEITATNATTSTTTDGDRTTQTTTLNTPYTILYPKFINKDDYTINDGDNTANIIDASSASEAQLIRAGAGNDTITASAHGDAIIGGAGDDIITLGAGIDKIVYQIGTHPTNGRATSNDKKDIVSNFEWGKDKLVFAVAQDAPFTDLQGLIDALAGPDGKIGKIDPETRYLAGRQGEDDNFLGIYVEGGIGDYQDNDRLPNIEDITHFERFWIEDWDFNRIVTVEFKTKITAKQWAEAAGLPTSTNADADTAEAEDAETVSSFIDTEGYGFVLHAGLIEGLFNLVGLSVETLGENGTLGIDIL